MPGLVAQGREGWPRCQRPTPAGLPPPTAPTSGHGLRKRGCPDGAHSRCNLRGSLLTVAGAAVVVVAEREWRRGVKKGARTGMLYVGLGRGEQVRATATGPALAGLPACLQRHGVGDMYAVSGPEQKKEGGG